MGSKKGIVKFLDVVICSAMLCTVTVTFLVGCHNETKEQLSGMTNEPAFLLYPEIGKPLVLPPNEITNLIITNQKKTYKTYF
ncbi:MAG: hypothetical protein LBF90_00870 [Prevotellaceae bacterium]|jgi:Na+/alanine symporter|nr:hypothetical protein [Prevotellaceae bacterium]